MPWATRRQGVKKKYHRSENLKVDQKMPERAGGD